MMRVGVTGQGADSAVEGVERAGGEAVSGSPEVLADSDVEVLVALGEDALTGLVGAGAQQPVLPVDAGAGVRSVTRDRLDAALQELVGGDYETVDARLLAVVVNGEMYRVFADVMLVTAEPARISEYGIHGSIEGEMQTVETVRADGVVVATPRGSHDYAKDARGPILAPGADTLSVVPIAPFRIDRTHWGLTPPITLTVERDDAEISLLIDGVHHGSLDTEYTVELTWGDALPLVTVSASQGYFSN